MGRWLVSATSERPSIFVAFVIIRIDSEPRRDLRSHGMLRCIDGCVGRSITLAIPCTRYYRVDPGPSRSRGQTRFVPRSGIWIPCLRLRGDGTLPSALAPTWNLRPAFDAVSSLYGVDSRSCRDVANCTD